MDNELQTREFCLHWPPKSDPQGKCLKFKE